MFKVGFEKIAISAGRIGGAMAGRLSSGIKDKKVRTFVDKIRGFSPAQVDKGMHKAIGVAKGKMPKELHGEIDEMMGAYGKKLPHGLSTSTSSLRKSDPEAYSKLRQELKEFRGLRKGSPEYKKGLGRVNKMFKEHKSEVHGGIDQINEFLGSGGGKRGGGKRGGKRGGGGKEKGLSFGQKAMIGGGIGLAGAYGVKKLLEDDDK